VKFEITSIRETLCVRDGKPAKCIEISYRLEDGYEGFVSFFAEEIKEMDEAMLLSRIREEIKKTLPKARPIGKSVEI